MATATTLEDYAAQLVAILWDRYRVKADPKDLAAWEGYWEAGYTPEEAAAEDMALGG